MLTEYSTNATVSKAVAQLMANNEKNPYTGRVMTTSDIVAVIMQVFGRRAASSLKLTLH